jgi:Helix-turn-helix domain
MRNYKPKPKAARGRMMRAARLRSEGMSLRQIAAELQVHHSTVAADLAKWEAEQAKVSVLPVGFLTPGGKNPTPGSDSADAPVISLRRLA